MLQVLIPSPTEDLTDLATVKDELGIAGTDSDARLSRLIRQASDAIALHTGQVFGRATVQQTERFCAGWTSIRLDRQLDPVVSSVTEDGAAVDPDGWELDGATLYRLSGDLRCLWNAYRVDIVYASGFVLLDSLPFDVERAAILTVAAWHMGRARDPMLRSETAEGIGAASYIAGATMPALPPQAVSILQPWRGFWA